MEKKSNLKTVKNGKTNDVKTIKQVAQTIQDKQKDLQEQIKRYNRIHTLIVNRTKFEDKKTRLAELLELNTKENESFEENFIKLKFVEGRYNDNDIVSISNQDLIIEFIRFITEKIDGKIEAIDAEIMK